VTYDPAQARRALVDELLDAAAEISTAIAYASAAHERLDDTSADRLEAQVFAPLQKALGTLRRAAGGFAARHGDPAASSSAPPPEPHPSQGVAALLEGCGAAARTADEHLGALQDSLVLVELGDADLRAGVSDARRRLGEVPTALRAFTRTLGR
jgi:hypothetical protein